MTSFWTVLLLSLLPGAGNFAGGLVAEFGKTSPRLLNLALHAASGIVVAIVAVELIPQALDKLAGWWIATAFSGGGVAYILLGTATDKLESRAGGGGGRSKMWMIYIAVAVDLSSDGLMIGTSSAISPSLAIVLAAGQVLADVPEGYATVANFRSRNVPRLQRILLSASFFLYVAGAAILAYFFLRSVPDDVKAAALVFVAGLLTVAAVEDMLEEAHELRKDNRRSILAFIGGFTAFTLVSAGLETALTSSASG